MRKNIIGFALGATLLAFSFPSAAQQRGKISRLGFLGASSLSSNLARTEAFQQGLRDLGYVEGKSIIIEYRWAEGRLERLPELAAELLSLKPDVILTQSPSGALAAKKATTTIPIVFVGVGDPVGIGVVASLARPGGNVTGLTNFQVELSGKRLELLRESFPKIASVAVFWNPLNPGNALALKETEAVAQFFGIKLLVREVRSPNDFDGAFQAATSGRAQALLPPPGLSYEYSAQTDIGLRGKEPVAGNVFDARVCGSRRTYVLCGGPSGDVSAWRDLRRQDPQRI